VQLFPWEHPCFRSRYLVTAVVELLISLSLSSNGSTCNNINSSKYPDALHFAPAVVNLYAFCMILSTNRDYFPEEHYPAGFGKGEAVYFPNIINISRAVFIVMLVSLASFSFHGNQMQISSRLLNYRTRSW
jgi:hypothetical protein